MKNIKKEINKFLKKISFLIKKTLLKHKDQTDNIFSYNINFKTTSFNKYLIGFVFLLFVYLFYLSLPSLYEKNWVQQTIEKQLSSEYNLDFSISSEISYEILPSPHFNVKNAKIFNNSKKISEIKVLKIFIYQNNLFFKENLEIKKILIEDANFIIQKKDIKFYDKYINQKFSLKKIKIKNSKFFLNNSKNEIVSMFHIDKLNLLYNEDDISNKIALQGEVFQIPFILNFNKNYLDNKIDTKIVLNKLKFKSKNASLKKNQQINGLNKTSIVKSKLITRYSVKNNKLSFNSEKSFLQNNKITYYGQANFDPFDLKLDINLEKIELKKIFNLNSIFYELLKSGILFNENLTATITLNSSNFLSYKLFNSLKIVFDINTGSINLDKSEFLNNKIGLLKLKESGLFFQDDDLFFIGNFNFKINDINSFYQFFHSPKRIRKNIKNIDFKLEFNISKNLFKINNFLIDDFKQNQNFIRKINNPKFNNIIEFKNLINQALLIYAG